MVGHGMFWKPASPNASQCVGWVHGVGSDEAHGGAGEAWGWGKARAGVLGQPTCPPMLLDCSKLAVPRATQGQPSFHLAGSLLFPPLLAGGGGGKEGKMAKGEEEGMAKPAPRGVPSQSIFVRSNGTFSCWQHCLEGTEPAFRSFLEPGEN